MTAPQSNPKLQAAFELAARGFYLSPANNKVALVKNWEAEASNDPAQLEAWGQLWPNCNWAIAPHRSGHFVLDLDRKNGKDGVAELERLSRELGFEIADTLVTETSTSGLHVYLRGDAQSSVSRIAPGIDVRGRGGYVIAPGSEIDGKPYKIIHDIDVWEDLPEAPPVLLALANKRREATAAADGATLDDARNVTRARRLLLDYVARGHVAIEGQGGDNRTYEVCAEVLNLGVTEEKAFDLINEFWNAACIPPWSDDELRVKIENASRYSQNEAGAWAVSPITDRLSAEALDKLAETSGGEEPKPVVGERTRGRYAPIFARDFSSLPKPVYAIEKLVPARSITLIYGASGSFKSFIVQDLLASAAAGIPALDSFATVQGPAVMSAGEAPYGIAHKRAPAWALARGIEDLSNFPFAIVPAVPLVSDAAEVNAFLAALKAANIVPSIVAFDTVARAMGGLDENEARAAGLMITAAEHVIAELGCAVILVAHSGKDEAKGVRGSSALFAGVDAVFNVSRAKETLAVKLTCEKMKDADPPEDIHLQGQAVAGSLVFTAISADAHAALSRTNPPLAQADIQKALREAGAVGGVEISTRQLAVSMLAAGNTDSDPKALQAMEKRLRRSAEKQLAAYVVSGSGRGSALKWSFPTIANVEAEHV